MNMSSSSNNTGEPVCKTKLVPVFSASMGESFQDYF